jgi:hypothetical protein
MPWQGTNKLQTAQSNAHATLLQVQIYEPNLHRRCSKGQFLVVLVVPAGDAWWLTEVLLLLFLLLQVQIYLSERAQPAPTLPPGATLGGIGGTSRRHMVADFAGGGATGQFSWRGPQRTLAGVLCCAVLCCAMFLEGGTCSCKRIPYVSCMLMQAKKGKHVVDVDGLIDQQKPVAMLSAV